MRGREKSRGQQECMTTCTASAWPDNTNRPNKYLIVHNPRAAPCTAHSTSIFVPIITAMILPLHPPPPDETLGRGDMLVSGAVRGKPRAVRKTLQYFPTTERLLVERQRGGFRPRGLLSSATAPRCDGRGTRWLTAASVLGPTGKCR